MNHCKPQFNHQKEKKNFKSKIKSLDKYKEINEFKNTIKGNNINEKNTIKNSCSKENIIYSKKCIDRKQIQFVSPSINSNSCQKKKLNKYNNEKQNNIQKEIKKTIFVKGGSQINIFPKNNNQIIQEKLQTNKNNKDIALERKTINNKDSNVSRKIIQKIIPSGMTKKIKVNKIANLNG